MESISSTKTFSAGEIIMAQGEAGHCAYFIQDGKVEIIVQQLNGDVLSMGTRGAGSIIGEMAIVDDQPRSATIRALENCQLLEISKEDFSRSVKTANPIVRLISQVIVMRYRDILRRSHTLLTDVGDAISLEMLEREYAEQSNVLSVIKLANEFKFAISNKQLFLQYQPIVDLHTSEVLGFEALMRWNHPVEGIIPPDEFIPMAEDSGLIVEATNWAFRESCLALHRIENKLKPAHKLFMSINFSATDFEEESFFENFSRILQETKTDPTQIHLEITERLLLQQPTDVKSTLSKCRAAGMGVAIDDFGTGYSSLGYLHQYPINILKIDRSFIRKMLGDPLSMGLIKSILTLNENMGLKIIAEGVETFAEVQLLREMNCAIAQGYYFSRPMDEESLVTTLLTRNVDA